VNAELAQVRTARRRAPRESTMNDKIAASILVQIIFNSDDRLRELLMQQTKLGPEQQAERVTATFLKPWFTAMLEMVSDTRP
jgi:hypothetical protein